MKHYLLLSFVMLLGFSKVTAQTYCSGGPSSTADSEIASVQLTGATSSINYAQICPGTTGLNNQTSTQSADLVAGSPYTLNVNYGTCGGNFTNQATAYIDFDGDGIFSPAEAIGTTAATQVPFTGNYSFTVPAGAIPGITRMRVIQWESTAPTLPLDPCGTFTWGSMIDFEIVIVPAGPCTNATVTDALASSGIICLGDSVNLTATGVSFGTGTVYQWQSSPDSINWTNMTGPNTVSRNSGPLTVTTYFRLQVTCGATTVASSGVKVEVTGTPLPGGTYTINSGAPTGGTNFTNFNDFVGAIFCGGLAGPVVVNVVPGSGPYNEQVVFENINTTATNTLTINGNGETLSLATPIGATGNDRGILVFDNTSHVTVDSLTVLADSTFTGTGAGVIIGGTSSNITIKNSRIDFTLNSIAFNSAAILVSSNLTSMTTGGPDVSNNITIENNVITGGYNAISIIAGSNTNRANNNIIRNNLIHDYYIYGIYSRNQDNLLVDNNDFSRPTRSSLTSFYGAFFTGEHAGVIVSNNSIHDPFVSAKNTSLIYAMYMSSASGTAAAPNLVYNNIFYNLENNGTLYGIWNATSSHWKYYHNTIDVNDANPTAALTRGFYLSGNSDSVDIVNNIVSISRTGTSTKHCIYVLGAGVRTINNNGYFMDFNASTNTHVGYDGSNQTLFSDWVANANGWDNSSVFDNADFSSASTGALVPASGAMNDLGQNLLSIVPVDYVDTARTATPDPGAFEFDPPPCPRPSVNIASRTDTSSLLTWTSGIAGGTYNIEWGPAGFTRGTGFTQTITGDSVQLTGLAGNTCYDIYVQLDCSGAGNGFSQWSFVFTWCTNCSAIVPPFNEGFEAWTNGLVSNVLESCYSYATQGGVNWQINTGGTSSGSTGPLGGALGTTKYMYLETSSGATNDEAYLILPIMDVSGLTSPEIRFFYHMYGATTNELRIDVSDNLGVTWDSIWGLAGQQQTASADPYILANASLAAYGTSTNLLIRIAGKRGTSFTGDMAVDNITVDEAPQCPLPSFPTIAGITPSDVTVQWTTGGGIATNVSYGAVGFTPANGVIASTVDTFLTVSGLTPQTTYEIYIQDSCSDGTLSPWVGPLSFTTACLATTMPYTEDYSVWPNTCWSYNTGSFVWEPYTTGGVNYAQARFWSFSTGTATMTTLPINITSDAQVRYNWSRNSSTFYTDSMFVLARIVGTSTWDTLKVFGDPNFGVPNAGNTVPAPIADFQEEIHYLPSSYVGNAAEIRFVAQSDFGPNVYMDFFTVEAQPPCPDPTQLVANTIAPTTVNLGWTQAGSVTEWDVEWGPVGFTPGTGAGTVVLANSNPFNLTGLTPGDCIDIYVRANCTSSGNGFSAAYLGPLEVCLPYEHDIVVESLVNPNQPSGCGDSAMAVLVEIRNNGEIAQNNIPLTAIISGAFTSTLNTTYSGPLAPGAIDTVVVGTLNTFAGGYIDVLTYSNLSNDQNRINDTLALDSILLLPGEPTLLSGFACGNVDSVDLEMQSFPGAQYTWWDAPVAGNQLASGDIFRVPTANPGPYYVEYQTGVSGSLTTTLAGGSGCGAGNMFDLIPSSTLAISGFDIVPFATSPTHAVEIYMVVGSHTATTTQADWTLVHTTTVNATANVPVNVTLPSPVQLNANQTYGFYVLHNASYTATANSFNNADLSFISGNGNCTAFDYCCTPRTFNGVIYYESAGCAGPRVPISGTVFTDTASANFTYTETSPGQFSFDATTSTGVQFDWDFGDGNTGSGISTSHVYGQGGNYTVTLLVTDTVCASTDTMVQTINTTVSAEDLLIQQSLKVFPNPSTGIFNVVFEMEGTRDLNLRVLNATGQVILDEPAGRFSGEFRTNIDLSGFAKGIYLLQVQTEKGVATRRLSLM